MLLTTLLLLLVWIIGIQSLSPQFIACQTQKPNSISPLQGCPPGTIFVSQDAKDKHYAHFKSVQDAVLSLPESRDATILIVEGEYEEVVNMTRKGPLTLLDI